MASKKGKQQQVDPTPELLRDLLIVELAKAGVSQPQIRKILGCGIHRVSRIARYIKKGTQETN